MAQTNYTPISLYYSTTASAVPTAANLVPGELAINTNDGKLYYEDSSGVVQVLATKSTGSIGGSTTQVQFNNSGSLGGSSSFTWDGTTVTATKFAGALNGTVGATTASTGAFTTLSATGRATFAASGFGAISASTGTMQGQTLYGGVLAGNGSSYDVMICNRSGSEVLGVIANTQNLYAAGNVGIGLSSIATGIAQRTLQIDNGSGGMILLGGANTQNPNPRIFGGSTYDLNLAAGVTTGKMIFYTNDLERMRIDSSGNLLVGKTVNDTTTNGCNISAAGRGSFSSNGQAVGDFNRTGDDGTIINFLQDGTIEGSISVSGSTVSYNGGHLSRWSQWQNQSGQPDIYRGTVLESTNDMCEWNQTNEQSTKTIVSITAKSKAVAGVFDMYDSEDKINPNDFYVAQSGDFVIRIAQGVVVENGDLLESAGNGTARPQTDDICRSSTIAKVTSNYVSTTYADGSFCVPCILMIG